MHFHPLDSSFCAIGGVLVRIASSHLLRTIRSRLFAIIEGLQHARVGTSFGQQEVVLENASTGLLLWGSLSEFWRSVILQVLHETGLSFVHNIIVMRSALFRWVVEPRGSCVRVGAEAAVVQICFLILLFLSCDGSSSVRKLAASVRFVGLVQSVSVTVSRRLSTTAVSRVVSTRYLRTVELGIVIIQV